MRISFAIWSAQSEEARSTLGVDSASAASCAAVGTWRKMTAGTVGVG